MRDEIMIRVPNSTCIFECVCLCFLDNVVCANTHANIFLESLHLVTGAAGLKNVLETDPESDPQDLRNRESGTINERWHK